MSLTQVDLSQIRTIVIDAFETLAMPRFERIEKTQDKHSQILREHSQILGEHSQILQQHSQILGEHSRMLHEHGQRLTSIEDKLLSIECRLQALEDDIKELYSMVDKVEKNQTPQQGKLSKLDAEQKMLAMYRDFQALAKQLEIKLPAA